MESDLGEDVVLETGGEEEGASEGEDWLLGGERKAKVSMGLEMRLCPSPGRPFPFGGSTRRSRSRTSNILHRRSYHGSSRRRSCEHRFGPSEAHVALAILRRHAGRRTGRSWQLLDHSFAQQQQQNVLNALLSIQTSHRHKYAPTFGFCSSSTATCIKLISEHIRRLLCMQCLDHQIVYVRFVHS